MAQSGGCPLNPPRPASDGILAMLRETPNPQMFTITYQVPYNNCEWRQQSFPTLEEAERMVAFYRSCGSPAKLINN
jgi:hypothetical protein